MMKSEHAPSIREAIDLSIWVSTRTNELSEGRIDFDAQHTEATRRRVVVASSLCCMTFEHQTAITCLVDLHRRTSAFALLRPTFDAFWRALWVAFIASDEQVQAFAEGPYDPKFETASKLLDKIEGFPPMFAALKHRSWSTMSAYTHGSGVQVQRWFAVDTIMPAHPDDETVQLLHQAGWFSLVAATLLANVTGRDVEPCDAAMSDYLKATEL